MHHYIIAISGFSGVGKDEFAKRLVTKYGAIQTGLVDPAKRHLADTYDFSYEQLFGPSSMRNAGDLRYPKKLFHEYKLRPVDDLPDNLIGTVIPDKKYWWCEGRFAVGMQEIPGADPAKPLWPAAPYMVHGKMPGYKRFNRFRYFIVEGHPSFWLSPREALQKYCELMNNLYGDTWVRLGIETHKKLATIRQYIVSEGIDFKYEYDRKDGLYEREMPSISGKPLHHGDLITCFADFRHWNEIRYARQAEDNDTTIVLVRVKHPRITTPPYQHKSETEQATIPDSKFDFVVMNDGTIEDLYLKADVIVKQLCKDLQLCGDK